MVPPSVAVASMPGLITHLAELVLGVHEDEAPLARHLLAVGEERVGVLAAELFLLLFLVGWGWVGREGWWVTGCWFWFCFFGGGGAE